MPVFSFNILQEHAPKPEYGKPCNNCGLCCRVDTCQVSRTLLGSTQTPCIALEFRDGKFVCGMLTRPEHYLPDSYQNDNVKAFIDYWVHPGFGCEMPDRMIAVER